MLFQMCNDCCDVVLAVSALERSSIRGTYMHVYIRINIRTIHACIHEHKVHTIVYTHTYMHFAVLTTSYESQHHCETVSRLVMSLSPSSRITYSLVDTIKFEMPISEVCLCIFTLTDTHTHTQVQICIDTQIEMYINIYAHTQVTQHVSLSKVTNVHSKIHRCRLPKCSRS